MNHAGHGTWICSECNDLIEQCNCPESGKHIYKELCKSCAKKAADKTKADEREPWSCDECKSGDLAHCVRPEHCYIQQQKMVDKADSMLDEMRDNGIDVETFLKPR